MPSPLGHFLAGLAVGVAADPEPPPASQPFRRALTSFTLTCGVLAAAPDLDLIVPDAVIDNFHRSATHSFVAVALVFIVSVVVTGKVTPRANRWWYASAFAAAWSTHLLMDWLGADPSRPAGIQLLWPFSPEYFTSGIDFFPATERNIRQEDLFLVRNFKAAFVETVVGIPLVTLAWWTSRLRARLARRALADRV